MDEYKNYYYEAYPPAKFVKFGNIDDRLELKKKLGCRPFRWYIENVYPELQTPYSTGVDGLQIMSKHGALRQVNQCLDTMGSSNLGRVYLYECHNQGANQDWEYTSNSLLKHGHLCATITGFEPNRPVILTECVGDDTQVSCSHYSFV